MKLIAIILAAICTLLIPVTGFIALFAGMAMDAPGSSKSPGKWLFVFSMMLAPIALLGAVVKAWTSIARNAYSDALWWSFLGLTPFALALLLLHFDWFDK
jgi:hypothetical protein